LDLSKVKKLLLRRITGTYTAAFRENSWRDVPAVRELMMRTVSSWSWDEVQVPISRAFSFLLIFDRSYKNMPRSSAECLKRQWAILGTLVCEFMWFFVLVPLRDLCVSSLLFCYVLPARCLASSFWRESTCWATVLRGGSSDSLFPPSLSHHNYSSQARSGSPCLCVGVGVCCCFSLTHTCLATDLAFCRRGERIHLLFYVLFFVCALLAWCVCVH
jgi:hypothetical protein